MAVHLCVSKAEDRREGISNDLIASNLVVPILLLRRNLFL